VVTITLRRHDCPIAKLRKRRAAAIEDSNKERARILANIVAAEVCLKLERLRRPIVPSRQCLLRKMCHTEPAVERPVHLFHHGVAGQARASGCV
jgi:hypothetical protein